MFGCALCVPGLRRVVERSLPQPGSALAPSMPKGFLQLECFATGIKGSKVHGVMYFPRDPGYIDTARMLVESGLCLALDAARLASPGGVLTPAFAMGPQLMARLATGGTELQFTPMP